MATAATASFALSSTLATTLAEPHDRRPSATPAAAEDAAAARSSAPDGKEKSVALGAALERLTEVLRTASVSVQFEIDSTSHRVITKVVDKSTGEMIRQIPTEELVRISDAMSQLQGLFVRQTV
jgi:flagellar protein FlaG